MRLVVAILILVAIYVAWGNGTFDNLLGRTRSSMSGVPIQTVQPEGPGERAGAAVDRGLANAGRAVQRAGRNIEKAANGMTPQVEPTP